MSDREGSERRNLLIDEQVEDLQGTQSLFAAQTRLLEMIATGVDLTTVLRDLVLTIEDHAPGTLCSILLVDEEGRRLRHRAAPSLPEAYNRAIDGISIGPAVGSCGTAAFTREPVIVADVMSDPRWIPFRDIAAEHGLRAAWSTPILSSAGRVLGTLAVYYRKVQEPLPGDLQLIAMATHLAGIAIERDHAHESQRRNLRNQTARKNVEAEWSRMMEISALSPAMIAVLQGPDHVFVYANPLYIQAIGNRDIIGKPLRDALPEIRDQIYIDLLDRVYTTGEPGTGHEALVRLDRQRNGVLEDRYFDFAYQATRDVDGKIDGIFVHAIDITEQREARRRIENLAEERGMLASLVENSRDVVAVATMDQEIIYLNPAGRDLVGLDSDKQVRVTSFDDLVPAEERDRLSREIMPVVMRDGQWGGEVTFRHARTQVSIPTLWNVFTIRESDQGDVSYFACVARDVRDQKRVEEELLYQSQLMTAITDNAASALFMMDDTGCPTFMNPAAERITGYTLDEIRHQPLHNSVHHHHPDGQPYLLSECPIHHSYVTLTAIQDYEDVFIRKDGSFFPVVCSIAPMVRDGFRTGAVLEVRDVTEQKRVEEERVQLLKQEKDARAETLLVHRVGQVLSAELDLKTLSQTVTDATTTLTGAHFGVLLCTITDQHGESRTLRAISGAPEQALEELPDTPDTPLLQPAFQNRGVVRLDDVRTEPRVHAGLPHEWRSPGSSEVISYLSVPVVSRSGTVIGGLIFGHPEPGKFTERHENIVLGIAAQTAIAMDNARLYQEAQEAIRARDDFLSIAAHELRTPVTGVSGSAQLLARSQAAGTLDDDRLQRLLRAIVESSKRLSELTDDLLDISRLRSGRMPLHLESVNLVEVTRGIVVEARDRYENREIILEILNDPCPAVVDTGRIMQVLTNLVDNAAKYSPDGGSVRVTLERDETHVQIAVTDQGIGLPADALEQIFEQFGRAPNAMKRELPGMGLGLYISQQIVEMHNGRIWAESAGEDRGSTFRMWIPSDIETAQTQTDE